MEDKVRAHVIITGRVQGVFFRMETKRAADRLGVLGWVRNRRDGAVEALFEGNRDRVDAIIEWCKKGSAHARVVGVDLTWADYKGEFREFEITY